MNELTHSRNLAALPRVGCLSALFLLAGFLASSAPAQTFTLLKSFNGNRSATGINPEAVLVQGPDDTLYGTASGGGISGNGSVFKINPDGSGFTTLYSFSALNNATNSDGAMPYAGLVLSGNTLYGTAMEGGNGGEGTVFAVNTDGSGFTTLYSFSPLNDDTNSDGANPSGTLTLSGSTLYGTTQMGGSLEGGAIFQINTNGSGFAVLKNFSWVTFDTQRTIYTNGDGADLVAGLVLSGSTLYGTALDGGINAGGTVFKINTNGSGFTVIMSFPFTTYNSRSGVYTNSDGAAPYGALILSGTTLYGTAPDGGNNGDGVVFKVNTDSSGFTILHVFKGVDGSTPYAGLVLSGSTLYGTARNGGSAGYGVVFKVNTDGSGFTNIYSFSVTGADYPVIGDEGDGANPVAALVISGGTLYGTTLHGGSGISPNDGTVFKVNTDGSGFANLYNFGFEDTTDGENPYAGLVLSGNTLYGTTQSGGSGGYSGTVFKVNMDGSSFTVLKGFSPAITDLGIPGYLRTNSDGAVPYGILALSGSTLYGTAERGGTNGSGTLFRVNTDGSGFTNLHTFTEPDPDTGDNSDGANPYGGLTLFGSTLYGTTAVGGNGGYGTVFEVNVNGSGFTTLYSFSAGSGAGEPETTLILSGSTLYGTGGNGVFKVNTDGTGFTILYGFTGASDGGAPLGGLVLSGNTLYGTAQNGGSPGYGTVFKVNTDGSGFTNVYSFHYSDGAYPQAGLILSGNILYGTTQSGLYRTTQTVNGTVSGYDPGSVFMVNTDGSGFATLYSLNAASDGANPSGTLTLSGITLYGTAYQGGSIGGGSVFSLYVPPSLTITPSGSNVILTWPTNATGFTLQSTLNLGAAAVWNPILPAPDIVNGQYTVTNRISRPQQFYQLVQ